MLNLKSLFCLQFQQYTNNYQMAIWITTFVATTLGKLQALLIGLTSQLHVRVHVHRTLGTLMTRMTTCDIKFIISRIYLSLYFKFGSSKHNIKQFSGWSSMCILHNNGNSKPLVGC